MKIFSDIAISAADIMLPAEGTDLSKWAVIACDQYTSEPEYWKNVEEYVGDAPSALKIVLPEVYLTDKEKSEKKLSEISVNIDSYLNGGIWAAPFEGFTVIDRKTPVHPSRKGLVAAVDLEGYSYEPGNTALIRATEGTVLSRIPPRVKIRQNAKVELPHVMLLIDDPEDTVIGSAWDKAEASGRAPVYDTDLMLGAGHVKGYAIEGTSSEAEAVVSALRTLLSKTASGMLFAVGDGNHSLASAKAHWDNIKKDLSDEEKLTHPARYALTEIVNIHDKGLDFEPIHRVVFGLTKDEFISKAKEYFKDAGLTIGSSEGQSFTIISEGEEDVTISLSNPPHSLSVGSVQMFLDSIGADTDYIHGEDSVRKLATKGNMGILLPDISKDAFFETIAKEGVFPRKTFSMGEAFEKRFYLEAKRIDG